MTGFTHSRKHPVVEGVPLVITEDIYDYRDAVEAYLRKDDAVLEVGCAEGLTTHKIAGKCPQTVGVDQRIDLVARARLRWPSVRFECMDGFDVKSLKTLGIEFTVIFVDISGSRNLDALLPMLERFEHVFQPRLVVVKNFRLRKLASQCAIYSRSHGEVSIRQAAEDRMAEVAGTKGRAAAPAVCVCAGAPPPATRGARPMAVGGGWAVASVLACAVAAGLVWQARSGAGAR